MALRSQAVSSLTPFENTRACELHILQSYRVNVLEFGANVASLLVTAFAIHIRLPHDEKMQSQKSKLSS